MNSYEELLNNLESKEKTKSAEFFGSILNLSKPLKVYGLYSKEIKDFIKKYKDIDLSLFELNKIYEVNFLYFSIALKRIKTIDDQIDFIFKNKDALVSWAITDSTYQYLKIKTFEEAKPIINVFLNSKDEFLIRYGYLILFMFLKDEENLNYMFNLFKNSEYFYVEMVEAWVLSYLYIYFPKETLNYLENSELSLSIKTKTIRKVLDSYRVSKENKDLIKEYRNKIKNN